MKHEKLSVNDWLKAAFRALTRGGPSAIKAEAIARDLGVSKGSFYWHFENVASLKTNMLAHWKKDATQAIISELDQVSGEPQDKLRRLVSFSTSGMDTPYGGPMVEAAIRDWARYDKSVSRVVEKVDTTRIDYVEGLFYDYGLHRNQSRINARIFYSSLIGLQILSANKLAKPRKDLSELLTMLLIREN